MLPNCQIDPEEKVPNDLVNRDGQVKNQVIAPLYVKNPLYSKPSVLKSTTIEEPPPSLKGLMINHPVINKDKSSIKTISSESSSDQLEDVKSLVVGLGRQNGLHTPDATDNVINSPNNSKHNKKLSGKKRKRTVSNDLDDFAHLSKSTKICHNNSSPEKLTNKGSSNVKRKQSINCTTGDSDSGIGGSAKFEYPPVLSLARKSLDQGKDALLSRLVNFIFILAKCF